MPAEKGNKMAISLWVDKDLVKKMDYLAEKGGLTRSKFMSNMIEMVVHDLMIVDKIGFVRIARFYHEMREYFKNKEADKDKKIMPKLFNKE